MSLDAEHQSGKAILKDYEDMYKQHPDWLIRKTKGKKQEEEPEGMGAAAGGDDAVSLAKKKKVQKMIEENKEIDPLDATKLDLTSPEICK